MNNNYIPNTSAIPNILIDYWMPIISPAEFKVLMCIARKTYGWHKEFDRISLKQIEIMTGLSRKGITKNLDSLLSYGLINKIKSKSSDGDDAPNKFEINVNCIGRGSELSTLGVVNSVHQGVVNSVHPQKKDNTKERLTKEKEVREAPLPYSSKKLEKRAEHIFTTDLDHEKLVKEYGIDFVNKCYEHFSIWKIQTPKSKWKKGDYLSIRKWVVDAVQEKEQKSKTHSKVVPGSFQNKRLPEDVESKIVENKAISERIKGIVADHCSQTSYFMIDEHTEAAYLCCSKKDVKKIYSFTDHKSWGHQDLIRDVISIFPQAEKELKKLRG